MLVFLHGFGYKQSNSDHIKFSYGNPDKIDVRQKVRGYLKGALVMIWSFDSDGTGPTAPLQLTNLSNHAHLSYQEIVII